MISGHLTEKSGYWYIILNLQKANGKKGPKWFSTGLKVKGNKRKAEELLIEMRRQYTGVGTIRNRCFPLIFVGVFNNLADGHEAKGGTIHIRILSEYDRKYNSPIFQRTQAATLFHKTDSP